MRDGSPGPVAVDLRAIQHPGHRWQSLGRYAYELALGLERRRPDLVGRYLLAPDWPPPGDIETLLSSGKVAYFTSEVDLPQPTRVYHSMAPCELDVPTSRIWPAVVERRGLRFSATVHRILALRHPDEYLRDPGQRRSLGARAEVLRQAEALLTSSTEAEADVVEVVGAVADRVTNIGLGVGSQLRPAASRDDALEAARRLVPGLGIDFVLYPGGSDERKNVEALVRAFAGLDAATRTSHQLVVPCELPAAMTERLGRLAADLGIGDRLLLPGHVTDHVLGLLYQSAALVCFPSLAETVGLGVAEAVACGAVTVGSDVPLIADLLPEAARFDPRSVAAITSAIERGLSDPVLRQIPVTRGAAVDSWDEVADRAAEVFDSLAAGRARPWRRMRRLAFLSPFPPIASGVAAYSSRLIEAVATQLSGSAVEIDCFADGRDRDASEPALGAGWRWSDARSFGVVERATGGYDDVVYVLGNSEYHAGALAALRSRRGVVIAHDVRLVNLLRFSEETPGAVPGGLGAAIARAYGDDLGEAVPRHDHVSADDEERFGLLMLRDVITCADRVLVSSEAALRLAALDVGPDLARRLGVLPFAVAMPTSELEAVAAERARAHAATGRRFVVTSFGIVDPTKQPYLLVEAVARLAARTTAGVDLSFVGPVSDELRADLLAYGERLGVHVTLTGQVPRSDYLSRLGRADIAVQLRSSFGGESSGAAGDCLAAGLATVVSAIGWLGDLPDEAVVKVGPRAGPEVLAEAMTLLLEDEERRRLIGRRAAAFAAARTFEAAAASLVAQLGLGARIGL